MDPNDPRGAGAGAAARPVAARVATLTLSDTRTPETDEGGRTLGDLLRAAGFAIASHAILREDADAVRAEVARLCAGAEIDAVVITGGTGVAPRDRTIEAVTPLFEKELPGFGEAFRRLSWDQIGAKAILSRAVAGVVGGKLVVALPGSVKAVRLAVEELVAPTLAHAVDLLQGRPADHGHARGHAERGGGSC